MHLQTRKILDKSFSGFGFFAITLMVISLIVLLLPIFWKGAQAFYFSSTIEFRKFQLEKFNRGNRNKVIAEVNQSGKVRQEVYQMITEFESDLSEMDWSAKREYRKQLSEIKTLLNQLLGPVPGEYQPVMMRDQYGETRWERARLKLNQICFREEWDYSDSEAMGKKIYINRKKDFQGTRLEPLFGYLEENLEQMLLPRKTFYYGFLIDESFDSHFFGGIWPEILGTFYLTIGAMLFAVPLGVIAAIYLTEFATEGKIVSILRIFISTLAGVPSIVFGLFGLAFFINTMHVSGSKSVIAGSMTLAILILPTIIRASEEAIRSVPHTFKEAAFSLGATRIRTVMTVILPAALPGILTGIVISMGRAAGETAPIIFTAAVSVGKPLKLLEIFNQPTPALSWNIYNLATEHEAVNEIRHVQFGMVFTLIMLVLTLNLTAILLRARITRKLRS